MVESMIGVLGAGTMGHQMIRRLIDSGHSVRVFDPDSRACDAARSLGAIVAADAAAAASGVDVCLLSLPTPDEVLRVVSVEAEGLLAADPLPTVVVDTSTVDPTTTRRTAQTAGARGVGYLDAPVLGRPDRCGHWTLPVGGDEQALQAARPTLELLAAKIVPVGPSGTGNIVKLLNNLMFAAINAVTAECLAGAERVGLDPAVFVSTVADSGAASVSNLFLEIGPKIVDADFAPAFTLDLLRKDIGLAVQMLSDAGFEATLGLTLAALNDRAVEAGLGRRDTSAMVDLYRRQHDREGA